MRFDHQMASFREAAAEEVRRVASHTAAQYENAYRDAAATATQQTQAAIQQAKDALSQGKDLQAQVRDLHAENGNTCTEIPTLKLEKEKALGSIEDFRQSTTTLLKNTKKQNAESDRRHQTELDSARSQPVGMAPPPRAVETEE